MIHQTAIDQVMSAINEVADLSTIAESERE